jgi:hypothetical protein
MNASEPAPESNGLSLPPFELRALRIIEKGWGEDWELRPAPSRRNWMSDHPNAYQCLPMVIANGWGWQILCPTEVVVTWDGSQGPDGLTVEVDDRWRPAIKSHFGTGIVTFSPPWLFRTPPGWDLYAKGPSNRWKENCAPLEGIVETWWLNYSFTMNWKVVAPGRVTFAKGESIAQLIPLPHATFTESTAFEAPIGAVEPDAAKELLAWLEVRRRIANNPSPVHKLYRQASNIEEHLKKVPVPKPEWRAGQLERTTSEGREESV